MDTLDPRSIQVSEPGQQLLARQQTSKLRKPVAEVGLDTGLDTLCRSLRMSAMNWWIDLAAVAALSASLWVTVRLLS